MNKLLRAQRVKKRLCLMNNSPPPAKFPSSWRVEAQQFQAYCIICNEFATSVGKSLLMFVSSVNNFSWANLCFPLKGEVLTLGGWWKAFKPSCFEHQTACLKICSQSGKWRAEWRGKTEREKERYWHEEHQTRCQVSDFKVLLRGCTAGADKDNPKVSWQLGKEIKFDSERTFLTCRMNNLNKPFN